MADSKHKDIIDAIKTALEGVSGVGKVTQDERTWAEADVQDMGILFLNIQKPRNARAYFPHPTADDMEGELMIDIHGQTLSEFNSEKRAAVDEVRQAVETTLDTDSALQALVMDIYQISSTIDIGSSESRGFFLDQYVATYQYNHASP